jgi:hypothetical protein
LFARARSNCAANGRPRHASTAFGLLRVIRDQTGRLCLLVDIRFSSKATYLLRGREIWQPTCSKIYAPICTARLRLCFHTALQLIIIQRTITPLTMPSFLVRQVTIY